jgi:thiamine kinase
LPIHSQQKLSLEKLTPQKLKQHRWFNDKTIEAITALPAGFNHQVYRVELMDNIVIVRLPLNTNTSSDPEELKVQAAIATLGLAPRVLLASAGIHVIEYIDGTHIPANHWADESLAHFAHQLASIHQQTKIALGLKLPELQLQQQIEGYQQQLHLTADEQLLANEAMAALNRLAELPATLGLCHCDLNPDNIICRATTCPAEKEQCIIDWEFAAYGDVFFDLAGLMVDHQLNEQQEKLFVSAYLAQQDFALTESQVSEKLTLMKMVYRVICRLWYKKWYEAHSQD